MKICERCGVSEKEVRLFDAIHLDKMDVFCERCSIIENIPIIRKPNLSQLMEAEKRVKVYDRMKRLSGIKPLKKEETFFIEDKLKELDSNPNLELPEAEKLNLIDHFYWIITKNRRRGGLSHVQLAEAIGESKTAIEMIEKGKLPENALVLIRKIEQFFQIKLRKISERNKVSINEEEPVLLDEKGQVLEIIPEEEIARFSREFKPEIGDKEEEITIEKAFEKKQIKPVYEEEVESENSYYSKPIADFDVRRTRFDNVSIEDLRKLHRRKIEVTKREQIEEQKKIEERRRILQALRERDRIKMEEKKKQERMEKQKLEEEKRNIEARKNELRTRKESKDIDKHLGGAELLKDNKFILSEKNKSDEFE